LLIFLVPYSLFSTVAVVLLWLKKQEPSLELLRDPYPEERVKNNLPLPAKLRGKFGEAITLGNLAVIPQKVEWGEPSPQDKDRRPTARHKLTLTLQLVNRSEDQEFNPVCQKYNEFNPEDPSPYTFLEAGGRHLLYGGRWEGGRRLGPDQETVAALTVTLTGPQAAAVRNFTGQFLWRVQLRRGFVKVDGKDVSATGVVGVEFRAGDILPAGKGEDGDEAAGAGAGAGLALAP
jgi:hypothetical protein